MTTPSSRRLWKKRSAHWQQKGGELFISQDDDPDLVAAATEELAHIDEQFGEEQATAARSDLQAAIADARATLKSERLAGIMNFRDKRLAHSLSQTRRERVAPVDPMKPGDEHEILTTSCNIIEVLHRVVNGKSFSFEDSQDEDCLLQGYTPSRSPSGGDV
jgi:AbiU2